MEAVLPRARNHALVVVFVALALLAGFLFRGSADTSTPEKPATIEDLLLIATKAKQGIFMAYQDVSAAPNDTDHSGHVPLNSFQFGVGRGISSPTGGAGREASAPSVSEVVVTKQTDQYSVNLFEESLQGGPAAVVLYFVDLNTGAPYLKLELDDTMVSGFSMSSGGQTPSESLSLNFTRVTMTSLLGPSPETFSWDLATNSP